MNPRDKDLPYESVIDEIYTATEYERRLTFREKLEKLEQFTYKGVLLDMGCSYGYFIDEASDIGWAAYGTELCEKARACKPNSIVRDSFCFPNEVHDAVTMFGLIEHVKDPIALLTEAHRVTSRNGVLMIETPDFSSFSSRLMGSKWWSLMRRHIQYFHPKSIGRALSMTGWDVIYVKPYYRVMTLGYLAWNLRPYVGPVAGLLNPLKNATIHICGGQMEVMARRRG